MEYFSNPFAKLVIRALPA